MKRNCHSYHAGTSDKFVITLNSFANVLMMDDENYKKYKAGRLNYKYRGGFVMLPEYEISPPIILIGIL